jgi:hypothetical protein
MVKSSSQYACFHESENVAKSQLDATFLRGRRTLVQERRGCEDAFRDTPIAELVATLQRLFEMWPAPKINALSDGTTGTTKTSSWPPPPMAPFMEPFSRTRSFERYPQDAKPRSAYGPGVRTVLAIARTNWAPKANRSGISGRWPSFLL